MRATSGEGLCWCMSVSVVFRQSHVAFHVARLLVTALFSLTPATELSVYTWQLYLKLTY